MKRSEINKIMVEAVKLTETMNFLLPSFAYWTPEEWESKGEEYNEIKDNLLGWDITDFGSGDFNKSGLLMFTIRNGNLNKKEYQKPYAEKLLIVEEEQITPYHFHWNKMEDIINRGGGNLMVKLYGSTESGEFSTEPVAISMDGRNFTAPAGTVIRVMPGESITLSTGQYHSFWGEKGTGKILLGEVSKVNNDHLDNRFYENIGRFPVIQEDEAPLYLLINEYPNRK
ncbi:MAG: D-lyxose/D-mannose family sugar isomerase [Gorillibacterium sp.]|nr:D-lyxose/D-mannose family sugar isomerase [Gorillibacterium sp.]